MSGVIRAIRHTGAGLPELDLPAPSERTAVDVWALRSPPDGSATAAREGPSGERMEFEIQFARDGDNPGLDKYHVHIRCFAAWEFERLGFEPQTRR